MRLFRFRLGGLQGLTAILRDPGDYRSTDDTLELTIDIRNDTDDSATAISVDVRLESMENGRRKNHMRTEVPLSIVVPAHGAAVVQVSVPLSLDAVADQIPAEVPQWLTEAIGAVSDAAQQLAGTVDVEVSVRVHFQEQKSAAKDSRTVTRHGPGTIGFHL